MNNIYESRPLVTNKMKILLAIKNFFYEIKWFLQRIIRNHGAADIDLWSLDFHLAKIILPKLIAFRKSKLHGYPNVFCTWEDLKNTGQYKNKLAYKKAIKDGEIIGGGFSKWLKIIDEIIFGFEFVLADSGYDKYEKLFFKKYGNWYEVKSKNRHVFNLYEKGNYLTTEITEKLAYSNEYYFDEAMHKEFMKRAMSGLKLFGKYYFNLWD
jgi:hypothetical protein